MRKFQFPKDEDNKEYAMGFLYGLVCAGVELVQNSQDNTLTTFPKISITFNSSVLPEFVLNGLRDLEFVEINN